MKTYLNLFQIWIQICKTGGVIYYSPTSSQSWWYELKLTESELKKMLSFISEKNPDPEGK